MGRRPVCFHRSKNGESTVKEYSSNFINSSSRGSESDEKKEEVSLSVQRDHIEILEEVGQGNRSLGLRRILHTRLLFREADAPQASKAALMALEYFQEQAEGARSEILKSAKSVIEELLEESNR